MKTRKICFKCRKNKDVRQGESAPMKPNILAVHITAVTTMDVIGDSVPHIAPTGAS